MARLPARALPLPSLPPSLPPLALPAPSRGKTAPGSSQSLPRFRAQNRGNGVGSLRGEGCSRRSLLFSHSPPAVLERSLVGSSPPSAMKLFAGLLFPGLWLVLLSCCCRVQSENKAQNPSNITDGQAQNPVPAASNVTNHTSATPVAKPGTTPTTTQNGTLSTVPSAVLSKATISTPAKTTATATNATTTAANTTTAKPSTTKAPPATSKSSNMTTVTPKGNSTAVTATAKGAATLSRSSGFDVGSFIGGIVLTLGLLIIGYIGCRTYHAKRGVQYRTIDEHDAII